MGGLVSLERLENEKYARVICYPRYSLEELRAKELICEKSVRDLPVLGKGCVSVVVLAHTEFSKAASKIRRTDTDRSNMKHESEMLGLANSVGVGPKLIGFTENFLPMEYVDWMLLPD